MQADSNGVRVQLQLQQPVFERLKMLKEQTEASSYAEVVRKSLKLYQKLQALKQNGEGLLIQNKDGSVRQIELLWL